MQWIVEPKMDIVERLNTVREGMEAGLDDWPIASQIYEYKTAAEEITTLRQRVAELEKERDHWKNNHETEVRRARILKERTDMPIERVQAYERWGKDMAERDQMNIYCAQAERLAGEAASARDALKQQRDELVAALEDVYKRCALSDLGRSIVSAAIASVKEKA